MRSSNPNGRVSTHQNAADSERGEDDQQGAEAHAQHTRASAISLTRIFMRRIPLLISSLAAVVANVRAESFVPCIPRPARGPSGKT